jgi:hypothetical protein
MRKAAVAIGCVLGLLSVTGCVNVTPPDVYIKADAQPPPDIDSSKVPETRTHEEARQELVKAYSYIRYLERKLARADEDRDRYKRERDEYKDKYKHLKDRYED